MNRLKNVFSSKYIDKYRKKIKYLGPYSNIKLDSFLLSRLIIEITLFIICILIPKYGILIVIIAILVFHALYTYILIDNKIKIRNNLLYDEAIDFYNMLKLSIKQTHDLKTSLDIVANKLNNSFSLEFKKVLKNNRYNNDINEVFNKVIETIDNNDVRTTLIDLKENNDKEKILDKIIKSLQEKNIVETKQRYQIKPFLLIFISMILISIIIILLFNIYDVIDYLKQLNV